MKVTTEKPEPGVATLTVEVPPDEFDRAVEGAWRRVANRVNIPGFRRGKAPRPLVERHVGPEAIDEEALRRLLPEQYDAAVEETGIVPIERPAFNVVQMQRGQPLVFTATVALRPTVDLGDYTSIDVEPETVSVGDEEVDNVVDRLRESQAQWLPVQDRGVEMGDMVIADLKIEFPPREDEPERQPTASERTDTEIIVGENGYPKGFDDQLRGATAGETRVIPLTWEVPAASPAAEEGQEEGESGESQGQPETRSATFTVTVKDIKRKELPDLDDAFAKSVDDYESLDALKKDIRRRLYAEALRGARARLENKVVEAAIDKATFEIPERLLELETDALAQERSQSLAQQRITVERYLAIMGTTEQDWRKELREQAERQLKARIVLDAIGEREGIAVEREQVEEEIARTAVAYGEQAAGVRRSLMTQEGMLRVATSMRRHRALEKLVEYAGGYPQDEMGVLAPPPEAGAPAETPTEAEGSRDEAAARSEATAPTAGTASSGASQA